MSIKETAQQYKRQTASRYIPVGAEVALVDLAVGFLEDLAVVVGALLTDSMTMLLLLL